MTWSDFISELSGDLLALPSNGVAGILELKKRPPGMVVAVVVPGTWEIRASKPGPAKGSFAGLPVQDLQIALLSPLNWSLCHKVLEQAFSWLRASLAGT